MQTLNVIKLREVISIRLLRKLLDALILDIMCKGLFATSTG